VCTVRRSTYGVVPAAPNPLDPGAATTASKSGGPKDRQRLIQEAEELRVRRLYSNMTR
jgi:hypothetical protein